VHQLTQGDFQLGLLHAGSSGPGNEQDVEAWLDLQVEGAQDCAQTTANAVANDGGSDFASR